MEMCFYIMSRFGLTNSAVSEAMMVNKNTWGVGGHQHHWEPVAAPGPQQLLNRSTVRSRLVWQRVRFWCGTTSLDEIKSPNLSRQKWIINPVSGCFQSRCRAQRSLCCLPLTESGWRNLKKVYQILYLQPTSDWIGHLSIKICVVKGLKIHGKFPWEFWVGNYKNCKSGKNYKIDINTWFIFL